MQNCIWDTSVPYLALLPLVKTLPFCLLIFLSLLEARATCHFFLPLCLWVLQQESKDFQASDEIKLTQHRAGTGNVRLALCLQVPFYQARKTVFK